MRYLIASDLHGSYYYAEKLWEAYQREQADKMIFLGDLLYHGPRNDLPRDYQPKKVIALMNEHKEEMLCVRGNCEAEVDQMVLQFPVLADYAIMTQPNSRGGESMIFITHGHHFNEQNVPMLKKGDVLLHGHTHVQVCREHEDYIYMNPGSLSIPKENTEHGYMIMEKGHFTWKEIETGKVCMEYSL